MRRTGVVYPGAVGTPDAAFTVIDNIRVSPPPTDVVVTQTEYPFEPGYPSIGTNLTVRCFVSNVDTNVPTDSRTVTLNYRWRYLDQTINIWRSTNMTYIAGTGSASGNGISNRYEVALSSISDVGDLEYYFTCDFGGYLYQSPDYTGTGIVGVGAGNPGTYPYASENLSPRSLRRGGSEREYYVRLRPYRSTFGSLYAETDQHASPIEMLLTGNNEWRAMVPVGAAGITNLTWHFKGLGEYTAGTGKASTNKVYWSGLGDVTGGGSVPYGGFCVRTADTARLNVAISSGAYAMLTLNTDTMQYMANRAEYQNFNLWPAPLDKFTESNGQVEKQYFPESFESWPTNEDVVYEQSFVGYAPDTNVFHNTPFTTIGSWTACSAKYVAERAFDTNPDAVFNARNLALRLKGGDGDLGLGYTYNQLSQLPDGLKKVAFNARLGQRSDNYDVVYWRNGFTNLNYLVRATAKVVDAVSLSPETPSVSLIAYYQDPGTFYEFRITQVADPSGTAASPIDKCVHYELYKWRYGAPTLLKENTQSNLSINDTPLTSVNDAAPVEMRLYSGSGWTRIRCKFLTFDNVLDHTDYSSPITYGTFGFVSSEAKASLSTVITFPTASDASQTGTQSSPMRNDSNFSTDIANWYYPTNRYFVPSNVSPKGIYSVVPRQNLGVYVQTSNYGSGMEATNAVWTLFGQVTVTNYTYQTFTLTMNSWQSEYVRLQVLGGEADVAVDGIFVYSWHGRTVPSGDPDVLDSDWTGWRGTEAWVATNTTSEANVVQLDHARANPAKDQALRSLLLTNGLGVMEFDYRVIRPPAKITVQYANQLSPNTWTDVSSLIVSNVVGWTHLSSYCGLSVPGYFRVLNERSDGYTNAWIEINDVTVWDEPYVTNTSWRAYNAKITSTDTNRVYLDESKACFLNNSATNDVAPRPQDMNQPFLQSPTLPKGMGTLSFYARPYETNETATVYVYASTNGWGAPTNMWFLLTSFTNINYRYYKQYTYSPLDTHSLEFIRSINAIRLMTRNYGNAKRVGLEEVVVTEPVLPSFDIINVRTMINVDRANSSYTYHPQPLAGEDIDVEARIANQQLSPSNIALYVSYYVGTNTWGIHNWPSDKTYTKRLHAVSGDSTLYRTRYDNGGVAGLASSYIGGITNQDADAVVQYYVWATYMGGVPLTRDQDTFTNPSWYYPVNLNTTYSALGWSPYYYVYNVPLNSVWINEVNASDPTETGIGGNMYVEIAMPAWMDLAGWSVDLVTETSYKTKTITIPSGLAAQTAVTNGYAFFVIGDVFDKDGVTPLPKKDYGYLGFSSSLPYVMPGGLRLKRPLGMYEQTVAYDWQPSYGPSFSGTNWAAKDPQKRFVYVGQEFNGGSLGRTGSNTLSTVDGTNTWTFPQTWTPGSPNVGQLLIQNGDYLQPGISNVFVTSVMNLFKGTQNGRNLMSYTIKLHAGDSTNIVYQINDWYRMFSLLVNNVETLNLGELASGVRSYNLPLSNLQKDVSINANVQLRSDLATYQSTPDVLAWILGFTPEGQLVPSYCHYKDGAVDTYRVLTMTEQYWLNANPTVSNLFEFATSAFTVDSGTNLHVTISMSMNGAKQTLLQGGAVLKLRAKANMSDPEWSLVAQYSLNAASFDSSLTCKVYVTNPFSVLLKGMDPQHSFYQWVIEMEDPRVEVEVLVNDTVH